MKKKFEVKISSLEKINRRKTEKDEEFYVLKAKDEEGTEIITITSAENFEALNPGDSITISIENPQKTLKK